MDNNIHKEHAIGKFGIDRRTFVQSAVAGALAPALKGQAAKPAPKKMVGIQIDISVLATPDHEKVLDLLQEKACVNTLFVKTMVYPGRAGQSRFHGGNSTVMHAQYYKDTVLKPADVQSPKVTQLDAFARLIPAARKRDMRVFPWVSETHSTSDHASNPIDDQLWERDLYGRVAGDHPAGPCSNNPNYRNFVLGLFEDYARSYQIDGVLWGIERQGPLSNALGAFHDGSHVDPGRVTCFCEFCTRRGKQQGLDVERVKAGFRDLEKYVKAGRAGQRPADGYYVEFWRILLRNPEILAWHKLWTVSAHEIHQGIHAKMKSINPSLQAGWHIWHNISFNPLFRAEEDYQAMANYSDYIKPVLYYNSAGARMKSYIDGMSQNVYGDLSKEQSLEFEYRVMNYKEGQYGEIASTGFTADYVYRETKRALEDVAGTKTEIWPGIDIDVPTPGGKSKSTPENVRAAVIGAMRAGAQGVLLSRTYTEMKIENLAGAGNAMRELGLV